MQTDANLLASASTPAVGDARSGVGRRPLLPPWTTAAAALTAFAILVPAGPGAKALAVVGLVVVPGGAIISLLGLAFDGLARRIFFATVTGVAFLMGVGLFCAFGLRVVGINHPLTRGPMLVVWLLVLALSVALPARGQRDPLRMVLGGIRPAHCWWLLGLGVLPAGALVGAARLNAGHGGAIAVVVCVACVAVLLVAMVSAAWDRAVLPAGPAIFMSVVALVWQETARGNWLFGSDIQHEYFVANQTATTGQYSLAIHGDAYRVMLSLTVLPAQLHALTTASVEMLLQLLPAVVLGLVVIGGLCVFRSLVSEGLAVGFTLLFVGVNSALLTELPSVTRQCYGLLLFVAMLVLIVAPPRPIRRAQALFAALGIAMVLAHYSTAFIAIPVLLVGWIFGVRFSSRRAVEDKVSDSLIVVRDRSAHRRGRVVVIGALIVVVLGVVVASTRSQLSRLRKSIDSHGLGILPGHGGVLSRWIHGAGSKAISASTLQQYDRTNTTDRIAHYVDPRALQYHLTNASAPKRPSVHVLGPISSAAVTIANELVLIASVIAVVVALVWLIRGKARSPAGVGGLGTRRRRRRRDRPAVRLSCPELRTRTCAGTARHPAARSAGGDHRVGDLGLITQAQTWRHPSGIDRTGEHPRIARDGVRRRSSGEPVGVRREHRAVRSDGSELGDCALGRGALGDPLDPDGSLRRTGPLGLHRRRTRVSTFDTVDPLAAYSFAWIYATPANIVDGRARGTANGNVAVFAFPRTFYDATRSVLFTTGTTRVYGPVAPQV